jgi:hypothetical protein
MTKQCVKQYNQFQEIAPQQERTARSVKEIQSVPRNRTATRNDEAMRKIIQPVPRNRTATKNDGVTRKKYTVCGPMRLGGRINLPPNTRCNRRRWRGPKPGRFYHAASVRTRASFKGSCQRRG